MKDESKIRGVWIDGVLVAPSEAAVPVFDRGFLFGDRLEERLAVRSGRALRIDRHLDRLVAGAALLRFEMSCNAATLRPELELAARTIGGAGELVLIVTRGSGLHLLSVERGEVRRVLHASEMPAPVDRPTVRVALVRSSRSTPARAGDDEHEGNFMHMPSALVSARERGADDAIVCDSRDYLVRATAADVFLVRGSTLQAPASTGMLLTEVGRDVIQELAPEAGLQFQARDLSAADLYAADEAFLADAVHGVRAITHADGRVIGTGERAVTERLARAF